MRNANHGFTLVELLITVTIAAILLSIGLPSFTNLIANNRLSAQANEFISALNMARSEAIKRGTPVCVKRKGSTEKVWGPGWDVFVDSVTAPTLSDDKDRCKNAGTTIQTHDELVGSNTLNGPDNFKTAIRFNAFGVAVDNTNTGISGTFTLCRGDGVTDNTRTITISTTGSITVAQKNSCN